MLMKVGRGHCQDNDIFACQKKHKENYLFYRLPRYTDKCKAKQRLRITKHGKKNRVCFKNLTFHMKTSWNCLDHAARQQNTVDIKILWQIQYWGLNTMFQSYNATRQSNGYLNIKIIASSFSRFRKLSWQTLQAIVGESAQCVTPRRFDRSYNDRFGNHLTRTT